MNVLIVDDESLIRYSLTMTLKAPFTTLHTAASGAEALTAIREHTFDLCFLDLHLPDMSGLSIMKEIRASSPKTRIVIISGEFLTPEMKKLVQDNAVLFLEKPFDLDVVKSFASLTHDQLAASPAERRRYTRAGSETFILCSTLGPDSEGCRDEIEAWLRDISSTGMGIRAKRALVPGCQVRLFDGMTTREGTVRWSRAADLAGMYNIGIQFTLSA